jgi:hypothetical protein
MWSCVLLRAVKDFVSGYSGAYTWFTNNPDTWEPGGFDWICDYLDLGEFKQEIRHLIIYERKEELTQMLHSPEIKRLRVVKRK